MSVLGPPGADFNTFEEDAAYDMGVLKAAGNRKRYQPAVLSKANQL